MTRTFKSKFQDYAVIGDSLTAEKDGFEIVARLAHDDDPTPPDKKQDGFFPSLNPKSAGYIGPKSERTLARHMAKAKAVLDAWHRDGWSYCGVIVTASRDGVELGHESLWGLELNYPSGSPHPNRYLDKVAAELVPEALADAKATLTRITNPIPKGSETAHP